MQWNYNEKYIKVKAIKQFLITLALTAGCSVFIKAIKIFKIEEFSTNFYDKRYIDS